MPSARLASGSAKVNSLRNREWLPRRSRLPSLVRKEGGMAITCNSRAPQIHHIIKAVARVVAALFATAILAAGPAQAQTLTVLHTFTGGADGGQPIGTLTMDRAGNLYGTASTGGFTGFGCFHGCGTVFKLTQVGSSWIFAPLYSFQGESDGSTPYGGVTIGPNGSLYGTTGVEGTQSGGTVFNLQPPLSRCGTPALSLAGDRVASLHGQSGNGRWGESGVGQCRV